MLELSEEIIGVPATIWSQPGVPSVSFLTVITLDIGSNVSTIAYWPVPSPAVIIILISSYTDETFAVSLCAIVIWVVFPPWELLPTVAYPEPPAAPEPSLSNLIWDIDPSKNSSYTIFAFAPEPIISPFACE